MSCVIGCCVPAQGTARGSADTSPIRGRSRQLRQAGRSNQQLWRVSGHSVGAFVSTGPSNFSLQLLHVPPSPALFSNCRKHDQQLPGLFTCWTNHSSRSPSSCSALPHMAEALYKLDHRVGNPCCAPGRCIALLSDCMQWNPCQALNWAAHLEQARKELLPFDPARPPDFDGEPP